MSVFPGLNLELGSPRRGPLRVGLVCMQFAGPTHCGGVGTAFFSLAEALAEHGHDVQVVLAGDELERASSSDWQRRFRRSGIAFVHLPRTLHRGSRFDGRAEASFNCHQWLKRRPFDVIHFHEWLGLGYYPVLAKRQGLAYRSTLLCVGTHGPEQWALQGNGVLSSEIGQLETHAMERESVRLADVVVSPSQYLLQWLEREGWSLPERTYVHPNVLWSKAISAPRRIRVRTPVSELVFFGRLEPRKGLYRFCEAVDWLARASRRPLRVTFLGRNRWLSDRAEWGDQFLRGRSLHWPYPVSILTDRNHEEALDYLREPGRLAVVASRRENSPYTVLECLGAGVSLICADVGGVRELVHPDDRARVLFEERDLAQKLGQVLVEGASPARPAVDLGWVRDRWVRWHEIQPAGFARAGPRGEPERACATSFDVCVLAETVAQWERWLEECPSVVGCADRLYVVPTGAETVSGSHWASARAVGSAGEAVHASESDLLLIANAATYVDPRFVEQGTRVLGRTSASMVTSVAYRRRAGERGGEPASPLVFPIAAATSVAAFRPVLGNQALLVRRRDCAKVGGRPRGGRATSIGQLAIEWTAAGLALEVMPEPLLGTCSESSPAEDLAGSARAIEIEGVLGPLATQSGVDRVGQLRDGRLRVRDDLREAVLGEALGAEGLVGHARVRHQ